MSPASPRRKHARPRYVEAGMRAAERQVVSITCPKCGRTSYNPTDVEQGYCGACNDWTTPRP